MHQEKLFEDGSLSRPASAALAAAAVVAPALVSFYDRPSRSMSTRIWYAVLRKPRFNPPKAMLPIVWTVLDGALAYGAYRIARQPDTPELSMPVLELFRRYAWPGNIRQLANVLRTAAVMSANEHTITMAHLSDDFLEDARRGPAALRCSAAPTAPEAVEPAPPLALYAASVAASINEVPAADAAPQPLHNDTAREAPLPHTLEQAEIEMIRATLDAVGGNISAASKRLGVSRNTIYRKLRWNVADRAR